MHMKNANPLPRMFLNFQEHAAFGRNRSAHALIWKSALMQRQQQVGMKRENSKMLFPRPMLASCSTQHKKRHRGENIIMHHHCDRFFKRHASILQSASHDGRNKKEEDNRPSFLQP